MAPNSRCVGNVAAAILSATKSIISNRFGMQRLAFGRYQNHESLKMLPNLRSMRMQRQKFDEIYVACCVDQWVRLRVSKYFITYCPFYTPPKHIRQNEHAHCTQLTAHFTELDSCPVCMCARAFCCFHNISTECLCL